MEDLIPRVPSSAITLMTLVPGSQYPNRYRTLHGKLAQPDDSQQKFLCFPSDPCPALLGLRIVSLFFRTSLRTDIHRPSPERCYQEARTQVIGIWRAPYRPI